MLNFQIPKQMHVKESDVFSTELDELMTFGGEVIWLDDETISFVCSESHEMMDTESLELPSDPSHEYLQEKEDAIRQASVEHEKERVRLYGTDDRVMKMLCDETSVDLNRTLWRLKRGEDLQEQIAAMKQLREDGKYEEAHKMCVWLLDQNEKHGVGYDKALLLILKQTLAALSDEVHLKKALSLDLRLKSK